MTTNAQPIHSQSRNAAYEAFRKFSFDPNQTGDTLLSVAPPKLSATKSMMAKRAYVTRLAYRPEHKIAATSLLIPTEIFWASGYIPFNWEMFSSLVASHSKVIELTNKGSAPVPRCSFLNALKGSYLNEILPMPDVTVSSSAFCEGISHMVSEISGKSKLPHFHFDIPGYLEDDAVQNLANKLHEIFKNLCQLNGLSEKQGFENLHTSFYHSVKAKRNFVDVLELREKNSPVNLGLEPLHWHSLFAPFWGDEAGVTVSEKLKNDMIKHIEEQKNQPEDNSAIHLAMFSLIPYGRTDIWRQLSNANANFTFEGVNHFGEIDFPETESISRMETMEIFRHLAYHVIQTPVRGLNLNEKADDYFDRVKKSGAKGLIIFSHEHCQMLAPRLSEYENKATQHGIKFVSISGDCILGMPKGPTGLRLGTFLTELGYKEPPKATGKSAPNAIKNGVPCDVRVGIDFGSGFSKYMAINRKGDIVEKGLFTSGIDYPHLLGEIKNRLSSYQDINFALAGVGSDNQQLLARVHNQTTEINALILAVKNLCYDYKNFLVVDIGTQDVKVLKFYKNQESPWINTNKSCGAGTGMVLVQILERWKQSNPDITFDDIDRMALEASSCELVNTTCGIFAVTNVVSALIQSGEEKRKDILRGVYHYIANQAIKLLPPEKNTDFPMLLVGGIGRHITLQKVFQEKGFNLIQLPKDIPQQHLIAYGAALTLGNDNEEPAERPQGEELILV